MIDIIDRSARGKPRRHVRPDRASADMDRNPTNCERAGEKRPANLSDDPQSETHVFAATSTGPLSVRVIGRGGGREGGVPVAFVRNVHARVRACTMRHVRRKRDA